MSPCKKESLELDPMHQFCVVACVFLFHSAKFADNLSRLLSERGWLENLREKFTRGFDFTGFHFMENRDEMWQESSVEVISGDNSARFFILYVEFLFVLRIYKHGWYIESFLLLV